jgi:transposase
MEALDGLSTADLRDALDAVDAKTPALRLVAAIAYSEGITQRELATWFGVERKTIYNWLSRIDPDDVAGSVQDAPRPGRPRKLTPAQQADLAATLDAPPEDDAERWSAPRLQEYIAATYGVDYSLPSCRRILAEHDAP